MSDTPTPFEFQLPGAATPAAADPPAANKSNGRKRGARRTAAKPPKIPAKKRGPRRPTSEAQPAVNPAPKRPRKARALKIDLGLAMSALSGLTEDDAKFVAGVVQAMQAFGKAQRSRIVGALAKLHE